MLNEFFESKEGFELNSNGASDIQLIQMQLNEAIAEGDESLIEHYKNQLSKAREFSENASMANKDVKLGGGLSAYQVLKLSANDDLTKAADLRRDGKNSEADYYENRGKAQMRRYEEAVERNKAEAERIKKEAEERRQRDKEYREKEEAEKKKLEEQRKAEENKS